MKKARACFADGGQISKADQLIAEMNAKYGVSGNSSAPAPVAQQPAVQQPEPKPQSKGLIGDAMNIFSNRAKQIDKAAGYANGGKVRGYALGGIPDFGDNSQVGLEKRLAAMQASNGGAAGSVTAQWNTADQNDLMNNAGGINPSDDMAKKLGSSLMSAFSQPNSLTSSLQSGGLFNKNPLQAFSNGGLIEGIGTPTSDSIPAKVQETGEDIAVSTKERIVSHEQDKLLQRLAKAMGFDSVDAFFEAGTGKPVGPTIKGGKRGLAGGGSLSDEEKQKIIQSGNIAGQWFGGSSEPKIYGDNAIPAQAVSNGNNPAQADTSASAPSGQKATLATNTNLMAPGLSRIGQVLTSWMPDDSPLKRMTGSPATPSATNPQATTPDQRQANTSVQFSTQPQGFDAQKPMPMGIEAKNETGQYLTPGDGKFITGIAGAMPDSSGGGFSQGGKNYTVNPTSQDGIKRVTANGQSPLYTNINPEQGVAGLKNQTIGQPADQEAQGLARIANANKIRGEMIANRDKDIPAGGYAPSILADRSVEDNAALDAMRRSSMISNLSPSQQAEFNMSLSKLALQDKGQNLASDNARYAAEVQDKRAAGHDSVIARGQDLTAQTEAARIAGNPVDNQAKQLSLTQAQKMAQLYDKAANGDAGAIKELQLRNPKEPNYGNRYVTVPGGEETGPDGMTKIRRPSRVFDAQTGQWINEGGQVAQQQSAPASAIEYLKKNPNQAEAFKAKYGYIPAGL